MKRYAWIVGGAAWIAAVAFVVVFSVEQAGVAADVGTIEEPSTARVAVVYASGVVFALPGVGFVLAGLWRRGR
jgi:hypothetical protein